jgi:hypothetical protein
MQPRRILVFIDVKVGLGLGTAVCECARHARAQGNRGVSRPEKAAIVEMLPRIQASGGKEKASHPGGEAHGAAGEYVPQKLFLSVFRAAAK